VCGVVSLGNSKKYLNYVNLLVLSRKNSQKSKKENPSKNTNNPKSPFKKKSFFSSVESARLFQQKT